MRYSTSIVILTLNLLTIPLATAAWSQAKIPRLGVLEPTSQQSPAPCIFAFQQGLRALGYVEGHTLLVDYRYAEEDPNRLPALLAELIQLGPDVIWLHSTPGAWAAKRATTTIPIVIGIAADMVEQGIVESLAQPGGNLTGLEQRTSELAGKRLELLKEAIPTISRVAVLVDPRERAHAYIPNNIAKEAHALGVQLQRIEASDPPAFKATFAAIVNGGAEALMIMDAVLFAAYRRTLLALALHHRLPTMAYGPHLAEAGSLLAYGTDPREMCRRSSVFVHKILQGATPADLPIERAKFQLVVNLKTAEALGLTLSPLFLSRADRVIR